MELDNEHRVRCEQCELHVVPYVTPEEAHWKLECPLCGITIGALEDNQPKT